MSRSFAQMLSKYPRLGRIMKFQVARRKRGRKTLGCEQCGVQIFPGEVAYHIDIQWWHMRGDDSVVTVCGKCGANPDKNRLIEIAKHQEGCA